jgi:hypothetical protein
MTARLLLETMMDEALSREINLVAGSFHSLNEAELAALTTDIAKPLRANQRWTAFCNLVQSTIRDFGYIVVRGLKPDGARSLLVVSSAMGGTFDTYQAGRIIKHFRMSPWTSELSHTARAGDFHTDRNVAAIPPIGTAMQCDQEDPGAPEYGEQRVAYLPDLLDRLANGTSRDVGALNFLTQREVVLAHEQTNKEWRGRLVQNDMIRYHPHSLRVASKRLNNPWPNLEEVIACIHQAATDVSVLFHIQPGDAVLLSNRAALHFRGECSVRFLRFPTEFESRSLFVLHVREPAQPASS